MWNWVGVNSVVVRGAMPRAAAMTSLASSVTSLAVTCGEIRETTSKKKKVRVEGVFGMRLQLVK